MQKWTSTATYAEAGKGYCLWKNEERLQRHSPFFIIMVITMVNMPSINGDVPSIVIYDLHMGQ